MEKSENNDKWNHFVFGIHRIVDPVTANSFTQCPPSVVVNGNRKTHFSSFNELRPLSTYFKGRRRCSDPKGPRRMACRFLITLYLLVVKVVADTKATKCQFFGLSFGVSSGLCLLFTFRLYQCFRKLFIGFSETLFFHISILLLHSLPAVFVRLLLFIDLML